MAKESRKIDYADFHKAVGFDLNREQQEEISTSCGLPISAEIWEIILQTTSRYTSVQSAMHKAPDIRALQKSLKRFEKASKELRQSVSTGPSSNVDPLDVVAYSETLPCATTVNLLVYVSLLDWLISYTSRVHGSLTDSLGIGFKGNGAWQGWVCELAAIVKGEGFSVEAIRHRKSPFQCLIDGLQMHMVPECRRFHHSERSLAEGIQSVINMAAK